MQTPLLQVQKLVKRYQRGWPRRTTTFELQADFEVDAPTVIGVLGANGTGKTTLFELITGGNRPSEGCVHILGQDIHRVRYSERDRLALHYHQSYQLRRFRRTRPAFMLEAARTSQAAVHLFDEPQFNTQDGYIGFMLDFFRKLKADGRLVFLCLHPTERYHLDILAEVCERYLFVFRGAVSEAPDLATLAQDGRVREYLGNVLPQ